MGGQKTIWGGELIEPFAPPQFHHYDVGVKTMVDNTKGSTHAPQNHTPTLSPSTQSAAYELHGIARCAVDAIRAIARHIDPGSPDYALCLNLEFIAGGLDRAADAFESADMDARKADGVAEAAP